MEDQMEGRNVRMERKQVTEKHQMEQFRCGLIKGYTHWNHHFN